MPSHNRVIKEERENKKGRRGENVEKRLAICFKKKRKNRRKVIEKKEAAI